MNKEMECVLAVLRGDRDASGLDMQQLQASMTLAETEKVLPVFLAKLRASGVPLSAQMQERCAAAEREMTRSAFWWTSELKGILTTFAAAGVQVILLKGPCLAERLYGSKALRMSRDLDLLVRVRDVALAGELLAGLGFARDTHSNEFHRAWRRSATMVELHTDMVEPINFRVDLEAVWNRAQPILFVGQPACILGPADELFFLCLHGVRHTYESLNYVLDVSLAFNQFGPQLDPETSSEEATRILALGQAMARHLEPADLPVEAVGSADVLRQADKISGFLWTQISEQRSRSPIWNSQRALYLWLQPSNVARLRYAWAVSISLHELDYTLANRFHIEDRRLIWILRQGRLILKALGFAHSLT